MIALLNLYEPPQAQARQPALINRQNQLGAKVITYLPLSSEVPRGTGGQVLTKASGGTYVATNKGRGILGSGAAGVASVPLNLSAYAQITIACWFYWPVYGVADKLLMEFTADFNANSGGIIYDPDDSASGTKFVVGASTGAVSQANSVSFARPTAALWHRLTVCFDITAAQVPTAVYVDGISQALTVVDNFTGGATAFANNTLHILSRNEASLFGGGTVQDLTIYKGLLSAAEAYQDYVNPYQILQPTIRLLFDNVSDRLRGQAGQMFAMGLGA